MEMCACVWFLSLHKQREVWMSLNHIESSHIFNIYGWISLTTSSSRIRSHFSHFTRHQHQRHALFLLRCEVNGVHTLRCQEEYECKMRTPIQELTRCEMFMPLILSQSHTFAVLHICDAMRRENGTLCIARSFNLAITIPCDNIACHWLWH